MQLRLLALIVVFAAPLASLAGEVHIPAGDIELLDVWRYPAGTRPRRVDPDVAEVAREHDKQGVRPTLCGLRLVAHARIESGEVVEWNLLFSLVKDGGSTVGGLSAAAFTLRPGAQATPRRKLAQFSSAIDTGVPLTTRAVASAADRHGVVAPMTATGIEQVWSALDEGTPIAFDWTDDEGATQRLLLRTLGTRKSRWYHGRNAPARRCTALLAADAGPGGATREVEHPW